MRAAGADGNKDHGIRQTHDGIKQIPAVSFAVAFCGSIVGLTCN
jgi:hypothetical protein